MISAHSSLASSIPATSAKVMLVCSLVVTRCRERPKLPSMPPGPPPTPRSCRKTKNQTNAMTSSQGNRLIRMLSRAPPVRSISYRTPDARKSAQKASLKADSCQLTSKSVGWSLPWVRLSLPVMVLLLAWMTSCSMLFSANSFQNWSGVSSRRWPALDIR